MSDNTTFEKAMEELEQIVQDLQSGNVPLDQAIAKYEEGKKKIEFCQKKLNAAEEKIRELDTTAESEASSSGSQIREGSMPQEAPETSNKSVKPLGGDDDLPF